MPYALVHLDTMKWYHFLKGTIFAVTFIFMIGGCLSMGITFWISSQTNFLPHLAKSNVIGVFMLIATLPLLVIAAIFGCVGVRRESRPLLGTFTVLLVLTLVMGTSGGIWAYVSAWQTDKMSLDRVRNIVLHDYGRDSSKTAILDIVQQSFQCCGSENYTSWAISSYSRVNKLNKTDGDVSGGYLFIVPESCCIDPLSDTCHQYTKIASIPVMGDTIYTQGCLSKLHDSSIPYGKYSLGVSIGVGMIEIVGILGSTFFSRVLHFIENATP